MLDDLMPKVRADGKRVRTLTVKVRYPDFTHGVARPQPGGGHGSGGAVLSADRAAPARRLAKAAAAAAGERAAFRRRVTDPAQLEMFAQAEEKRRRLAGVLDRLNRGGNESVVTRGHQLGKKR